MGRSSSQQMMNRFHNRETAGRALGVALGEYASRCDAIVVALPRGGVPVAFELARSLDLPLDLMIVRKLGVPHQPELAMGAIASGDVIVSNDEVAPYVEDFADQFERTVARERVELHRRERAYRGDRPPLDVRDKTVIVVDDGAATGSTMLAALQALRKSGASELVVALPIAPKRTVRELKENADRVICLMSPEPFFAVGDGYEDFAQTSDKEVTTLLHRAQVFAERSPRRN